MKYCYHANPIGPDEELWGVFVALVVVLAAAVLMLCGCAEGKQFTRASVYHYGSADETFTSESKLTVGRYFSLGPATAELTSGAYYDNLSGATYGLVGTGIGVPTGRAAWSATAELLQPDDGGDLQAVLYGSVEVTWP